MSEGADREGKALFEAESPISRAEREGLLLQNAARAPYTGRTVCTAQGELQNFAGLGYLGLELRSELEQGTAAAAASYGTQFPFPRAMLACSLYTELQDKLRTMTGRSVFVAASTTLAHLAALPQLVAGDAALLVEDGGHFSLHAAARMVDARVEQVALDPNLDDLERAVSRLTRTHSKVWFAFDGMASASGRLAPFGKLLELVERFPALHLYVDEAHATSWTGFRGRGNALELSLDPDRLIVVLSLNKAFGAAGAAVALPTESAAKSLLSGPGGMFSGPIQPPLLGAALASAELHLSPILPELQSALDLKIRHVIRRVAELDIPVVDASATPLFFVHAGSPETTFGLVAHLRESGFYVCGVVPPVVPPEFSGIRFSVTTHNQLDDIDGFLEALSLACKRMSLG